MFVNLICISVVIDDFGKNISFVPPELTNINMSSTYISLLKKKNIYSISFCMKSPLRKYQKSKVLHINSIVCDNILLEFYNLMILTPRSHLVPLCGLDGHIFAGTVLKQLCNPFTLSDAVQQQ